VPIQFGNLWVVFDVVRYNLGLAYQPYQQEIPKLEVTWVIVRRQREDWRGWETSREMFIDARV
jgi:hypothetical protein